ncbi:MAG: phage holin family protein [Bacteroidales bacterium]
MKLTIIKCLINAIVILVASRLFRGIYVESYFIAILVAVVISLLNYVVRPIILLLTLPLTLVTMGLFIFVINSFVILIADYFVKGFGVNDFWWALLLSLILSIMVSPINQVVKQSR